MKREEAVKWRHEYELKKSKDKSVQSRQRERKAAESSLEAYDINLKKIESEKRKSKENFFKQEEIVSPIVRKMIALQSINLF